MDNNSIFETKKFKQFKDHFHKNWIISIFKHAELYLFEWTASPRWFLGLGYSKPLIQSSPKCPIDSYVKAIENATSEIDKFELEFPEELNDLLLEYNLRNNRPQEIEVKTEILESLNKNIFNKPKEILKGIVMKKFKEIVNEEIKFLSDEIKKCIEEGKTELNYEFKRLDKILKIDEFFEAQNIIIDYLEKLEYKLKIDKKKLNISWRI